MKSGLTVTKDRVQVVMQGIATVTQRDVLVGIPSEKGSRNDEMTNPVLGYIHETGAPEANIPPRPWLLPAIRESVDKFVPHLKTAAQAAIDGQPERVEKALHAAGMVGSSAAQRRITQGPFVPLKASTLRARRRRGRTGTRPLIDTGQLRRSITYAVREP